MTEPQAPRRILLVEDDDADVELIRQGLAPAKERIALHVVSDGEQALKFLRRQSPYQEAPRPDAVLLDLNLPRLDGREVLRQVKRDEALRMIPVIILTTSDARADVARCYAWGANCYVTKPLGLDEFLVKLAAIERFWTDVVQLPPSREAWPFPPD